MTKLKNQLQVLRLPHFASTAILLIRIVVGIAFILHGWGKMQAPFSWMPPQALAIPGFLQFLAAFSEFGGGIALVLGLLTPLTSLGLISTMAVASFFHGVIGGDPFVNSTGGSSYELPLVYLCISLVVLAVGPGKFSLDAKIFGERK